MTDPLRRDPLEFLRVLKKMANNTSWQKTMLFASKGRQVGYRLGLDHYNTVLFSQSMWGRALEIIRTVRAMEEDQVQPNGASYYYICNGMANVDHGYTYDFNSNFKLPGLQHWRVALNALEAAEANGYDTTDTMHNSVIVSCTIPVIDQWATACRVLHKLVDEDRRLHPSAVGFFKDCLIRNERPREANALLLLAAAQNVQGYANHPLLTPPRVAAQLHVESPTTSTSVASAGPAPSLTPEELQAIEEERQRPAFFTAGLHPTLQSSHFRPRVYRQEWYKWHAIANKYRSSYALRKKQLAPRDSPSGIPGFHRL